jgi:hypothetical protein
MANRLTRTPEKDAVFFEEFARSANIKSACALSGYNDTSVYEWRKKYADFEEMWKEADRHATIALETEMYRRAVFGVTRSEPMLYKGKIVVTKEITEYSDTLAIFLAKARNPDKYRERIEVNVNWRAELKQVGIDPEQYFAQMIETARLQLEANADVIDVTASMDEELQNNDIRRKTE